MWSGIDKSLRMIAHGRADTADRRQSHVAGTEDGLTSLIDRVSILSILLVDGGTERSHNKG